MLGLLDGVLAYPNLGFQPVINAPLGDVALPFWCDLIDKSHHAVFLLIIFDELVTKRLREGFSIEQHMCVFGAFALSHLCPNYRGATSLG